MSGASLKAALDLDWDDPDERAQALVQVLEALDSVERWLEEEEEEEEEELAAQSALISSIETAKRVREQDVEEEEKGKLPGGVAVLRRGVARERLVSVEDVEMRHARKSRSVRFEGYKRHVLKDLDTGLVRAVGITAANAPEASVTDAISADLARQEELAELSELHIDRAYLSSKLVRDRKPGLAIYCKAWRVSNRGRFPKTAFELDWNSGRMRCPAGQVMNSLKWVGWCASLRRCAPRAP